MDVCIASSESENLDNCSVFELKINDIPELDGAPESRKALSDEQVAIPAPSLHYSR